MYDLAHWEGCSRCGMLYRDCLNPKDLTKVIAMHYAEYHEVKPVRKSLPVPVRPIVKYTLQPKENKSC